MDKVCKICGKTFVYQKGITGRKCCSKECEDKLKRAHDCHMAYDLSDGLYHGTCKHCGSSFVSSRKRMYCTQECAEQHNRERASAARMKPKGLCKTCGKPITKKRWIYCSDECNPKFNKEQQVILTDEIVRERISERYDHITYVSGHESGGMIVVQCNVCGHEFAIGERASRVTRLVRCRKCYERELRAKEKERKKLQAVREVINVLKRRIALLNDIESRRRTCKVCGKEFIMYRGQTGTLVCSEECAAQNKKEYKRDRRHKRRAKYKDSSDIITLRELYDRDNGTCYICGAQCDYGDMRIVNGTYTAGRSYPSIDHVYPLSKGGSHTWDNVRLACCLCNSLKSDRTEEQEG